MLKERQAYRPDIDGLRAVAVLLVVAFHLHLPLIHGGYIGVDIFFVISGFLITGIIAREIDAARFSVAAFYERRARRILPALIVMMLASTACALYYLLPKELCSYSWSMLGATFSYSNIYFWATEDYFDAPAQLKPLLHTWSLAVEEQFYLFLPLILLWCSRYKTKYRNAFLIFLALASFAWSAWAAFHSPASAFYLLPSRAWELLLGAFIALGLVPAIRNRWMAEAISLTGLILICFSTYAFRTITPFPGFAAALPCVGAGMILAAGKDSSSTVGKLLSLPPVRFIGLISYSVYLWHWPLIVFTSMGFLSIVPKNSAFYPFFLLVLSLVLGALSWKFVEQPFRAGIFKKTSRGRLFSAAATTMVAFGAISMFFIYRDGFPSRFPTRAVEVASQVEQPEQMRVGTCFITSKYSFSAYRSDLCLKIDPAKDNYLLLGDSHSAMLWTGLHKELTDINILQASVAGCNPVYTSSGHSDCGRMIRYLLNDFLPNHRIQGVFLSARWASEQDFAQLQPTIEWFKAHGIPVYCFGPVVEYDAPLPRLLAYSIAFQKPAMVDQHMNKAFFAMDGKMKQKAEDDWKVHYISIIDAVCADGTCPLYANADETEAFLGDDNHLSEAGSILVMEKLVASGQIPGQEKNVAQR